MKVDYRHVLVAVDLSEQDTYVVGKAKALAQVFQAKLSAIHVLDNIPMPDTAYGTIIPLDQDSSYEMLEAVKVRFQRLADSLAIDPKRRWMVWGVPGEEIVRVAREEGVDLIMVGSHGRHGLGLLLGSTANGVLHHAECDVMAVRLREEVERHESLQEFAPNPSC
jgi:universal stress protein A